MYNIAIIGAGPAGYVAAQRAAEAGLKVILFEDRELGGVCLNEGCIPTKTLLYSAKLYTQSRESEKFGVQNDHTSFDYGKILSRKDKVTRKLVGAIRVSMRNLGVETVKGHAVIEGGVKGNFTVSADGQSYCAENLLLCTGSHAFTPNLDWLDSDRIMTSTGALELQEVPASLAIIGGGVIGIEFASLFHALGSEVTVFELAGEILGPFDADMAGALRETLIKQGIKFFLNGDEAGKAEVLKAEKVLLCIGRKPNVEGFGMESVGLNANARRAVEVDEHMRTAVPGIYAAGDITGQYMLAHCASREAEVAVNDILGLPDRMDYSAVPSAVYCKPEIASTGLTEKQALRRGIEYEVHKLPLTYSGRFVAETERENGMCKIICEKGGGKVLGLQILGGPASEMISQGCLAIENRMTLGALRKVIFPHPSVSEIIKETSWSAEVESK
jgi:dihydrolipoamide dehydrogenase